LTEPESSRLATDEGRAKNSGFIWETAGFSGYPPLRSIAIIEIGENFGIIYGAQQLRGKKLKLQGLSIYRPIPAYAAFAVAIIGSLDFVRRDGDHIRV